MNTKFLTCTFKSIPSISHVALAGEGSVIVGTGSIAITGVCSSSAFINIYTAKERKMEGRKKVLYLTIYSIYCIYSYITIWSSTSQKTADVFHVTNPTLELGDFFMVMQEVTFFDRSHYECKHL